MIKAVRAGMRIGELLERSRGQKREPSDREVVVRTPFGQLCAPLEDEILIKALLPSGILEPGTTSVLCALIRKGDTVVDIGAHIGLLTLPAAKRVGRTGRVIALEPLARLADLLRRSMRLNGVARQVSVENVACGAQAGDAVLHVGRILGHSSLVPLENEAGTVEVRVRPLDDIVPRGCAVSVVKIDAEGYETWVWRGMQRVVSESPRLAVIVELGMSHLNRSGVSIDEWLRTFTSAGFRIYEIDESSSRCRPLRTRGFEEIVSVNLLLLRQAAAHYPRIAFA